MDKREEFYATIEKHTDHWSRISSGLLVLWFSGNNCQNVHDAEADLIKLGARYRGSEFDKVCGKTALTIKAPSFEEAV